jgi:two-component system sensor histidine kinase/response regulator
MMLTAKGQRLDMNPFRNAGIEESLVKPVKQSRLENSLARMLGHPATSLAAAEHLSTVLTDRRTARRGMRILLAEDSTINQKMGPYQLRKFGHQTDGNAALEALSRTPYDIILMDYQMPKLDGYETTRAIRALEQGSARDLGKAAVYIIAMTASAMQGERETCLAVGMNDYISKPVRGPELEAAPERWKRC